MVPFLAYHRPDPESGPNPKLPSLLSCHQIHPIIQLPLATREAAETTENTISPSAPNFGSSSPLQIPSNFQMRLLTHNMLSSNIKGVANGFPLKIEVVKVVEKEVDFNIDFLKNMFPKVEWKALVEASRTMGYVELPENAGASMLDSDDFLHKFHHALLELHLEEGALVCPETGRKFPVNKGIPNMLLHEDEV